MPPKMNNHPGEGDFSTLFSDYFQIHPAKLNGNYCIGVWFKVNNCNLALIFNTGSFSLHEKIRAVRLPSDL